MGLEVSKETIFSRQFREMYDDATGPLAELRRQAFEHFSEVGFPTPKHEDWKYTNVGPISNFKFEISDSGKVSEWSDHVKSFDLRRNGFTALNAAFGAFRLIVIPKETLIEDPIELETDSVEAAATFPHTVVVAEAGSKATIVESYVAEGAGFTNSAVQIIVGPNANLTHYRVQKDSPDAFNYGVTEATLGRGSRYDLTSINLGGSLSRHDIEVKFTAEGGEAFVDGLYMLNGSQHHDTHSIIDHTVPNCVSHQTYKGVLNDKSRGVFNGKVFVRENAHGTDAQQSNKNLLLSNDARVDTKPQLEIFNDDVKCSHGATVGQLEEEELFYLLTRGLPEPLARNLLTYGFAEEVINKIKVESIKAELDKMVLSRLGTHLED